MIRCVPLIPLLNPHLDWDMNRYIKCMKTARLLIILAVIGTAVQARAQRVVDSKLRKPNLIFIMADDLGYGDLACFGSKRIRTPHLDTMAKEGMRFTSYYTHNVCGVTRASLMTGCYPMRVGEINNIKHPHPVLHPNEITIAEVLRDAGYATALIGKWHLADSPERGKGPYRLELMPNAQGFDYYFGAPSHNGTTREIPKNGWRTMLMRNQETIENPTDLDQITKRYTIEAIDFIQKHKDEPFFLFLSHTMPHVVLGASEKFKGKSPGGLFADAVEEIDDGVGQLLAKLRELKLEKDTLVIFTSDNGPWIEDHLTGKGGSDAHYGSAAPLRGSKMMTWEGGQRVPTIAWRPGMIPAGTESAQIACVMDILPTFAAQAGAKLPDRKLDGIDLSPLLRGEPGAKGHDTFFYYAFTHLQAVRSGKWKLVLPRPAKPAWTSWSGRMIEAVEKSQLYDLEADISESNNIAAGHTDIVEELMKLVESAREDIGDYDRIGKGQRFFDEGEKRGESKRWLK